MNKLIIAVLVIATLLISACQSTQEPIHTVTPTHVEVKETENTIEVSPTPNEIGGIDNMTSVYKNEEYPESAGGGGMGGDVKYEMLSKYEMRFGSIPSNLSDIVGSEKLEEWFSQFKLDRKGGNRSNNEFTIVNAVKELNISREDWEKAGVTLSNEQLDAIYSNNQSEINRVFRNSSALYVNDQLYTPDWLATRTLTDYEKSGIPLEAVAEYLKVIDDVSLREEYRAIKSTLKKAIKTSEMVSMSSLDIASKWELSAPYRTEYYGVPDFVHDLVNSEELAKWMDQFVYRADKDTPLRAIIEYNVINLVRELNITKQDFIRENNGLIYTPEQVEAIYSGQRKQVVQSFANPYALSIGDNVFSIDWLAKNYLDAYQKAGITKDALKVYLDKIKNNSMFTSEVQRIMLGYNQL